jgi:hypothetical protein
MSGTREGPSRSKWSSGLQVVRNSPFPDKVIESGAACPLGVKRVGFVMSAVCPVYPKQQAFPDAVGTSHLCHFRTRESQCSTGRAAKAIITRSALASPLLNLPKLPTKSNANPRAPCSDAQALRAVRCANPWAANSLLFSAYTMVAGWGR